MGPPNVLIRPWQHIACDVLKLYVKFERNRTICSGVIAVSVFDLMTLNLALRVALGSGIIFTKTTTYPSLNYSFFDADTLCYAVIFDP